MEKSLITEAAKTAMHRTQPSAPLKLLLEKHQIIGRVLDYGCGHGADVAHLQKLGYEVVGYDPTWATELPEGKFDTVLVTYVLNVLPKRKADSVARNVRKYLRDDNAGGVIYFSTRTDISKDTKTQRLVTSVPKTDLFIRQNGFAIWSYKVNV